ncbi:tetraacyldisaccharide 4'-kinase [Comamonas terrigena]|uniref:tetraacyldisaccharide 4'-kinase n=2 Tax=Comamonas terrigena TaxID=32013 RepID=UPI0028A0B81D|nr:tetraacyldisaccharide 4'-kinase [Comamonas terrigena]
MASPAPASPSNPGNNAGGSARRAAWLRRIWQRRGALAWALWPLSLLYGTLAARQRRSDAAHAGHAGLPTIVVGNVIAGGAGKTPVTQAIVGHLQRSGWTPGIISRGYGRSTQDCRAVLPQSAPEDVGDEPLLLARSTGVPVFVAPQRLDAARALRTAHPEVDILVCDDGLQHTALARDVEICVFHDGGIGNGWQLPAGPLREPWPRPVDAVLHTGPAPGHTPASQPVFAMQRQLAPYALRSDGHQVPLAQLAERPLHALAAVARPERFFAMLQDQGLQLAQAQALPDHYNFESWQRPADPDALLICTEKDAVKLWPLQPDALAVPLELDIPQAFFDLLDQRLATARLSSAAVNSPRPATP